MITFLNINQSKNDWENPRINMDHVVSYKYIEEKAFVGTKVVEDNSCIEFELINGNTHRMLLQNLDPKKIIKRIDKLVKIVKMEIKNTDAK